MSTSVLVFMTFNPSLSYRLWGSIISIIACMCLPVDVLIFYREPFGFVGTMIVLVLGFIPFMSILAEAYFPNEEVWIIDRGVHIT